MLLEGDSNPHNSMLVAQDGDTVNSVLYDLPLLHRVNTNRAPEVPGTHNVVPPPRIFGFTGRQLELPS